MADPGFELKGLTLDPILLTIMLHCMQLSVSDTTKIYTC